MWLLILLYAASAYAYCPRVLRPDPPLQLTVRQPTRATPRIAGGELVSSNLYPYVVALLNDRKQLCTGSLISPHWFLTAAHCKPTITSKAVISSSQVGVDGVTVNISSVYVHPRYNQETGERQFDVAAVQITENARKLGAKVMKLSFSTRTPMPGSFVRTLGFGKIGSGSGYDPFPWALRQVDVPVAEHGLCWKNYANLEEPTVVSKKYHFCAGYVIDGGCDSCGGPVIQYSGGKPVLQGIVSTGAGCGYAGYPGLNVRISALKKWLDSTPAEYTRVGTGSRTVQVIRNCPAGKYLVSKDGNVAKCEKCPDRMVTGGGPRRACDECPGSMDRDTDDPSNCSCRAVKGSGLVDGACVQCEPGFYSGKGDNRCKPCVKGSYSAEKGSSKCKRCRTASKGATECPKR